jgi:hypothetical protein
MAPPGPKTTPDATHDGRAGHELAQQAKQLNQRVASEVARVVVGVEQVTQQLLIALLAAGHVLLEGVPGVAKTTLSKVFARLLGCHYQRVQFTPDLLPSDVTGTSIFDRNTNEFVLRKGPIFTQVMLADEINRAPAKTQAALLEAMQEYQVTVDGNSLPLTLPFMVMATQNPIEQEGVYRLPEAQLDRFLIRVEMGYPGFGHEVNLLKLHSKPMVEVDPIFGLAIRVHHPTGRGEPSPPGRDARGQPAGGAQPPQVRPGASGAGGPALLHARGRAGSRVPGTRPPPDPAARGRDRGQARRRRRPRHPPGRARAGNRLNQESGVGRQESGKT